MAESRKRKNSRTVMQDREERTACVSRKKWHENSYPQH